jgi:putative transposase
MQGDLNRRATSHQFDVEWQMHGKPELIHVDNAPEFHSEALERGCEQHGIKRDYRPKNQAHFGGIIERVIGTAMKMSQELPGTTFSNVQERGKYDSEGNAVLTLQELEKWLVLAIASYHNSMHGTLKMPPASFWRKRVKPENVVSVRDEEAFLIDSWLYTKERALTCVFARAHGHYEMSISFRYADYLFITFSTVGF